MQPSRFIEDLLEVCRDPAIKVLVVTRGGGGGLAAIGDSHEVAAALLSSGRVFYTALGHDKDVLLLDKYADQAFATPSALGQSLAEAKRVVVERTTLVERLQFLSHRVEHLTHENAMLSATLRAQNDPGGETTHYLKLEHEQAPSYTAHRHAPDIPPPSITPAKRYLLWALLGIIFFLVGRCSG